MNMISLRARLLAGHCIVVIDRYTFMLPQHAVTRESVDKSLFRYYHGTEALLPVILEQDAALAGDSDRLCRAKAQFSLVNFIVTRAFAATDSAVCPLPAGTHRHPPAGTACTNADDGSSSSSSGTSPNVCEYDAEHWGRYYFVGSHVGKFAERDQGDNYSCDAC
jgi:hypothetical protein